MLQVLEFLVHRDEKVRRVNLDVEAIKDYQDLQVHTDTFNLFFEQRIAKLQRKVQSELSYF